MRQIVYNAVVCMNCGRLLESSHVHDYKTCGCENETMIDGGYYYQRYGGKDPNLIHLITVFDDEPFEKVRLYASRYSLHKCENVRLANMSDEWINAAIEYNKSLGIDGWHNTLLKKELVYRSEKNIKVEQDTSEKRWLESHKRLKEAAARLREQAGRVQPVPEAMERKRPKKRAKQCLPWRRSA